MLKFWFREFVEFRNPVYSRAFLFLKLRKNDRQANRGKVLFVCADGIALKADLLCLQVEFASV